MNDISKETSKPTHLERLSSRIGKYDSAINKVADLHDRTLGTAEGPLQYDLSNIDPEKFPEYYAKASEPTRRVRLEIANRTFGKLLEQRDALSDLHGRATRAEEGFRKAEEEYLGSQANPDDDKRFEDAYERLQATNEEIAAVFQGRSRKSGEDSKDKNENIGGETKVDKKELFGEEAHQQPGDLQFEEGEPEEDAPEDMAVAVQQEARSVGIRPARIELDEQDVRHLQWVARVDLSSVPVIRQLDDLAVKVAEIRSGLRQLPVLGDFIDANTRLDNPRRRTLVSNALDGLIATHILLPDGSINSQKGLPMILAKDINTLIAMTSPVVVSQAIGEMPSVEKGILCASLSVAMKEKVGIPDLEFCDADDAASYLSNAMYDVLKPARDERIRAQRRRVYDQNDPEPRDATWQAQYHERDTAMPVDVEELLTVIMERDAREGGFAQEVIESLYRHNKERARSQSSEAQANILDNLLEELIEYCYDVDMLGDLQEFFASHQATSKYYRMISNKLDLDRGQELVEYV